MSSRQTNVNNSRGAKTAAPGVPPAVAGKDTSKSKINPGLIAAIFVTLFFAIALFIRVYPPFNLVFSPEGIKFTSNDSYFFMRLVDNLAHNFPSHMEVNPYLIFPENTGSIQINFFVWLLAVPAWIAGLGSPSQNTIDVVSVFMPAILGALTVVPVYFIGKTLFNRWAGVFAAGLIAIMPGEFLGRSILGFTDNHVAETLFTAVAMMFLALAVKTASQRQLTFAHLKERDWAVVRRPLIYALLAGFSLGIYIYTWLGALLFVFIAFVFFVFQFTVDHLKQKSTDYLGIVGAIFFLVALLMAVSISSGPLYTGPLAIAVVAMPVLAWLSRLMTRKKMAAVLYPAGVLALAVIGVGLLYVVSRPLFDSAVGAFGLFRPAGTQLTTVEMQPLISSAYGPDFTDRFVIAWGNFNVGVFLAPIALCALIFLVFKEGRPEKSVLLVWCLIILLATLGQRRFGYYLAVNVALLSGYLSWKALDLAGLKEWVAAGQGEARRRAGARARRGGGSQVVLNYAVLVLSVLIVFFGVFFWNIEPARAVSSSTPYAPSDAWVSSLNWLRENSPEPFDNPDAYYQAQKALAPGESYQYPESAYGVLSWWDYGYWITRISHRIPNANPSQDPVANKNVAIYFTSQDETSAEEMRQKLGSEYFVIDHETTLSKFWAIITWAGQDPSQYFDTYLLPQQDNSLRQVILYYPEYYRSMAVRLFNFNGQAVTPETSIVISYQEQKNEAGQAFKVITNVQQYATYEEATANVTGQQTGNYRIVGASPLQSPVPLEALQNYSLVHSSDNFTVSLGNEALPSVKIFKYEK